MSLNSKIIKIWLLVSFITLVVIPPLTGWYMRSDKNTEMEDNFFNTAEQLRAKKNYDGAIAVYDFIIENGTDGYEVAISGKKIVEAERDSYFTKAGGFIKGFIYGEIESIPSLIGCVSGDVFVWGDFRDFVKNSYRYYTGGEVDQINYILSTIGLASTVLPNIDIGISLCKTLSKFMTSGMRKFLLAILEEAAKLKKYDKVNEFMSMMGTLYKKIGVGIVDIIQISKDSDHFKWMSQMIEKYGKRAYSLLLIGGDKALKYGEVALEYTGKNGKKVLSFCLKYPKVGSRILKVTKKIAWDNGAITMMALAELLAMVSFFDTFILCLILWIWLNFDRIIYLSFYKKSVSKA